MKPMTCSIPSTAVRNRSLPLLALLLATMGCMNERQNEKPLLVAEGASKLLAGGRVNPTDRGPADFTPAVFKNEMAALCNPSPCVKPEAETNPVYKVQPAEAADIAAYKAELADQIAHENDPPPDPSDFVAASKDRPQPILDTLKFQARFYNGSFDDLTPYAYSRLMLIDVGDAPAALSTARRYEIKRSLRAASRQIVQLEKFIEINQTAHVAEPEWLETELLAAYQMRRNLLAELRKRELWANRKAPQAIIEGGVP